MDRLRKFQLRSVKVIWVVLLVLLFFNLLGSNKVEHYFITAATFIMVIHIWWGTIFYIKHVGHTNSLLELPVDISIIGLLLMTIFSLDNVVKWFILFGTLFVIIIIKYLIGLTKTKDPKIRLYIKTKIKIESPSIILFYVSAAFGSVFDYWWVLRFLSIGVFLAQIPFIYYLVFKKKAYRIPFD